jgi:hypothetical protein
MMRFGAQTEAFLKFVRGVRPRDFPACREGTRPAAFLIAPWMQTAVPWYSIALALLYRLRGLPVEFVFADTSAPGERAGQAPLIERVMAVLERWLPVSRLSAQPSAELSEADEAQIANLTELNAISYLLRGGQVDEEVRSAFRTSLAENLRQLHPLFTGDRFDHWVVPGGIYGVSGLAVYRAEQNHCRVATYDSGPGSLALGVRGVAAFCADITAMFQPEYADYVEAHRAQAVAMAQKEFELRRAARDRYGYSAHAYEEGREPEACDVLFPMNIFDDAAGLGGHRFFASPMDWMRETVGFILAHTSATIVLREHPGARLVAWRDDSGGKLLAAFPNEPRLRFISCTEKASTYQFLEPAKLVLPYSSSVGVEAAILGKQVIMESEAYYARLPFVQQAASRDDYFARILAALRDPQPLPQALREQALLCYFYGQVASYVDCDFTPQTVDFEKWVRRPLAALANEHPVKIIVDAMSTGTPSCRLQSEFLFHPPAEAPRPQGLVSRLLGAIRS